MCWPDRTSVNSWTAAVPGHRISSLSITDAAPRPMCCRSGLAPKLPPLFTHRNTDLFVPASSISARIRAPMAERFESPPTSWTMIQPFPVPGFSNTALL